MEEEVDDDLLSRVRAGDEAAAELLDRRFRGPLLRFCQGYLGAVSEAEDAVQDVLRKAIAAEEDPSNLRVWLYTVARNHCLNVRRGLGRRRDRAPISSDRDLLQSMTGQLTRLVRAEQLDELIAALERLSPEHREVLKLRYGDELAREEIAAVLGLSVSVVKSRLFEGMKKLREFTRALPDTEE